MRVHIQDPDYRSRSLCGIPWERARGGRLASSTDPPVVLDEESGSVNAVDCRVCMLQVRRRLGRPKPTAT